MNMINFVDMETTRKNILHAREFPYLVYLCARKDNVPVTEFVIDRARSIEEAGIAMYQHFEKLDGPCRDSETFVERVARIAEEVFGECVFSIVVKGRGGE